MFSFVVSHAREIEKASSFDWFTYGGRPITASSFVLHKGQRFGVRPSPCGSHIQLLTFGSPKVHTIDMKLAKRLAKNIVPD